MSQYLKRFFTHKGLAKLVQRWREDQQGGVALLFGLTFVLMLLFVAGAVDYSRWLAARTNTLSAVDSAVLAGARSLQTDNDNVAAAVAAANRYYKENTRNLDVVDDTVRFLPLENNAGMKATGQSYVVTPFLNIIGIPRLPVLNAAEGKISEAVIASGGKSRGENEISIMLDITGSMRGQKIVDLQDAAKDLIDIVLLKEDGQTRVALVPFSEAINIEKNWAAEVVSNGPQRYTFRDWWGRTQRWQLDGLCATERTGADAFTDASPDGQNKLGHFYSSDGECMPKSGTVIPLSSDKSKLKQSIDGYQASGNTAGHLGTAWAWYMLSPNWAQRVPPTSRPGPYGDPNINKIAILMTDGEYNTEYCNGVTTSYINCNSPNGSSTTQARTLCTNMKAAGITVYTVGFQLARGGESYETMRQCATDPSSFFSADDGDGLKQAFRDIALQISTLYLIR